MTIALLLAAALLSAPDAPPQAPGKQKAPAAVEQPAPAAQDEVVVEGLRDIDDPGSAVTRSTMRSARLGDTLAHSVASFNASMRVFACGIKPGLRQVPLLRAAVDGTMNSVRQDNAQRKLVEINAACALSGELAQQDGLAGVVAGDPNIPPGREPDPFYFDRGALFVRVLEVFAPDLKLTRAQTKDPQVLQRLAEREAPRARLRLPQDRLFLRAAVCFVRFQPELATRLVLSRAPVESYQAIEAAIVNRSRDDCIGSKAKVYFNPVQFRFFIADALYRWAVAAAGVDTLIPDDGKPRDWAPAAATAPSTPAR